MNFYRSSVGSDEYAKAYTYTVNSVPMGLNAANYFNNNQSLTNENIIIGSYVTGAKNMFTNCTNFNGSVKLGANITDLTYMFYGCNKFNSDISIPSKAENCIYMFSNCPNYNSNVAFRGNNYNNMSCAWMFANCVHFNQPFTIPEGVRSCWAMFYNTSFNQPIYIPASVNDCVSMFRYSAMSKNIYINGNIENTHFSRAVTKNNNVRLNVHYNGSYNFYNGTLEYILDTDMTVGWGHIEGSNGYYNSDWNIYIYNNYYAT